MRLTTVLCINYSNSRAFTGCPRQAPPSPTSKLLPRFNFNLTSASSCAMSQSTSPYPTQSSFYSNPPMMNASINPDTPPPPPPKPGSHEASRGGTPQNMSSMPTPQPPQPMRPDTQTNFQQASYTPTSLPAPPTIEEGWLPELVKEKR